MWLANPAFLRQEPPRQVQLALLLTLLWVALPLLWSLPPGVIALFGALWLLRIALWALNIKPLSWLWLVLLLVVAAASFAYRAFWMLRARPSSRYVGSRFRDEVVAMSRRQRRRAFWGNVLLCVLCVAAMVLVGVLVGGMGGSV